jgi:hypothetical protein
MSQFTELLQRGITIEDVQELLRWFIARITLQWKRIVLFVLLGSGIGLGGLILKPAQFKANMMIAVEEGETSGWQNLLAQFGLDVGGLNPGGIFEGESLVQLFSTRYMVERTLLDKAYLNGDSVMLVNYLYPYTKWGKDSETSALVFPEARAQFTPEHDSLLLEIKNYVAGEVLDVYKPDKKLSLINVSVTHEDKHFAKAFTEAIVANTLEYFLESITEKARGNLNVLRAQRDSSKAEMTKALVANANAYDNVVNPLFQSGQIDQYESFVNLQVANALYVEISKNLTLAEIGLRKQTPLIQVVERPSFPLQRSGYRWWQWMLLGGLAGGAFGLYQALFRKS